MPTLGWVLIWVAVFATIAFVAVREKRAGRAQPAEFDCMKHEAVREAQMNLQTRGPQTGGQFFGGGS